MSEIVLDENEQATLWDAAEICRAINEPEVARAIERALRWHDGSGVGQHRAQMFNRFLWSAVTGESFKAAP